MTEKHLADRLLALGLGFAAYSEEKVSDFLREVSARGETRKEDIAKFREDMKEKGDAFRREFSRRVTEEVETALKKLHLVTASEAAELRERLAELERESALIREELKKTGGRDGGGAEQDPSPR